MVFNARSARGPQPLKLAGAFLIAHTASRTLLAVRGMRADLSATTSAVRLRFCYRSTVAKLVRADIAGVNVHTLPIALDRAEREGVDFGDVARELSA